MLFDVDELDYMYADSYEDQNKKLKRIIRQLNIENKRLEEKTERLKDNLLFVTTIFGCMTLLLFLIIFLWII